MMIEFPHFWESEIKNGEHSFTYRVRKSDGQEEKFRGDIVAFYRLLNAKGVGISEAVVIIEAETVRGRYKRGIDLSKEDQNLPFSIFPQVVEGQAIKAMADMIKQIDS